MNQLAWSHGQWSRETGIQSPGLTSFPGPSTYVRVQATTSALPSVQNQVYSQDCTPQTLRDFGHKMFQDPENQDESKYPWTISWTPPGGSVARGWILSWGPVKTQTTARQLNTSHKSHTLSYRHFFHFTNSETKNDFSLT